MTETLLRSLPWLLAVTALSWAATSLALMQLRKRAILDLPNHRSSHTVPTPRGGGWGVMLALIPAWVLAVVLEGAALGPSFTVLGAAVILMALSWIDDLRQVPPAMRFAAQTLAVLVGLTALPFDALVLQGLVPFWLDRLLSALAWLWFVNLFNFMDGIDGITGVKMIGIGTGIACVWAVAGVPFGSILLPIALVGAALGFLLLNWHPAKIFMGDVGSVPVGFMSGWLLLFSATQGLWAPAIILPAYYLTDATITLARRLLRGEKVWLPHRQHFYQRATQRGWSHSAVSSRVFLTNAVLVACALASLSSPWWSLAVAAVAVAALLLWMTTASPRST
jgi:UDP-N-acetylmuramyl pentapeptide phosphotransferase/UDP-N-acetylglucosamine-1-phosphate transferase